MTNKMKKSMLIVAISLFLVATMVASSKNMSVLAQPQQEQETQQEQQTQQEQINNSQQEKTQKDCDKKDGKNKPKE